MKLLELEKLDINKEHRRKKSLAFDFYHQLKAKEEYLLELKLESGETIEIPDIELKKLFIMQIV